MGKRSGITKTGRVMNPADKERKQQRAKELKRNKKQRTFVRQAIVKGRNPDELIEQMSRLDDQEFNAQRDLSLNVIQEKRNKLRGSYIQIINTYRGEKEDKKVKHLERALYDYEVERARKEENYRAQQFAQNADFEEIPLPMGANGPDMAQTPYTDRPGGGPNVPPQLSAAMRAGILKKPKAEPPRNKHKYPPGPPPGLPPVHSDDEEEEDEDLDEQRNEDRRRRRVRFGEERTRPQRRDEERGDDNEEDDFAPVEIPEGMMGDEQQGQRPVYPPRSLPPHSQMRPPGGLIPPGMAPPPPPGSYGSGYPAFPTNMPPELHAQAMRTGRMPLPSQAAAMSAAAAQSHHQQQQQQSKTGLISYTQHAPHPSAVISAAPQVVKPSVEVPATEAVISGAPQMRNIRREATRFVPTAVKIQRPVVPAVIGPKVPSSSVAGPTRMVPKSAARKPGGQQPAAAKKTADEACDEFLRELEGLL